MPKSPKIVTPNPPQAKAPKPKPNPISRLGDYAYPPKKKTRGKK
jgi:hypothetical protein